MRTEWIAKRHGQSNVSQMHYARKVLLLKKCTTSQREESPELIREWRGVE